MNILVTGSKGQLGSELSELSVNHSQLNFFFTDVDELDICDSEKLESFLMDNNISYIINCAAYTAVDKAESEKELAFKVNAEAVKVLSRSSTKHNAPLIHISTDYVFDGKSGIPYTEDDPTEPNSVYGHSKLAGEKAIEDYASNAIIIRTAWLYSSYGSNFVKTMIRLGNERDNLGVVADQIGSPTYAKDLAKAILTIIDAKPPKGVHYYHYSNEGSCSWFEFAEEIFKQKNIKVNLKALETKDYPTPANRPSFSLLDKTKIKTDFDVYIPDWKESLSKCLKKL
jgi:dTDP-4-dehydrorhamnose reductase